MAYRRYYRYRRFFRRRPYSRRGTYIRGRGAYYGGVYGAGRTLRRIGGAVAPYVGAAAGRYLGGSAGAVIGSKVGSAIGRSIRGYGAYYGKGKRMSMGNTVPRVDNGALSGGSIIISHKEYLGDVVSSATPGNFAYFVCPLNPGSERTFPWLSQIAKNFQQYKFMGVAFVFKSMSGNALTSSNTALGTVVMATQYDAASPPFNSKAEMENAEFSQSGKPSTNTIHYIECAKSNSVLDNLYVSTDDSAEDQDSRFYNFGNFQCATVGFQGTNVNCGEMWVTYQVKLMKPKISDALGNDVSFYSCTTDGTGYAIGSPLGTYNWLASQALTPVQCWVNAKSNFHPVAKSNTAITFPMPSVSKTFLVKWYTYGGVTANTGAPGIDFANSVGIQQITASIVNTNSDPPFFATSVTTPGANGAWSTRKTHDEEYIRTIGGFTNFVIIFNSAGWAPLTTITATEFRIIEVPQLQSYAS